MLQITMKIATNLLRMSVVCNHIWTVVDFQLFNYLLYNIFWSPNLNDMLGHLYDVSLSQFNLRRWISFWKYKLFANSILFDVGFFKILLFNNGFVVTSSPVSLRFHIKKYISCVQQQLIWYEIVFQLFEKRIICMKRQWFTRKKKLRTLTLF